MTTESTPSSHPSSSPENIWHKVIAGIFAAVVAPAALLFFGKLSDKVLTQPEKVVAVAPATPAASAPATTVAATTVPAATVPGAAVAPPAVPAVAAPAQGVALAPAAVASQAVANPAATTPASATPSGSAAAPVAAAPADAASASASPATVVLPHFDRPKLQAVRLFNGRDLSGFYTYLGRPRPKSKVYGKDHDPDHVFSVEKGLLHVSGEVPGALETVKEYSDYWLTVEYKWGEASAAANSDLGHHSAVMLNIQGPDGVIRGAFPSSFHAQIMEGATGDLFVATGQGEQQYSLMAAVEERQLPKVKLPFFTPGAPKSTFTQGVVKRYTPPAPDGHGPEHLERPRGEWNKLECVSHNGKILVSLNDHVVNFAMDVTPTSGRIGIQSHNADIYFREITLQPYQKHHEQAERGGSPPAN